MVIAGAETVRCDKYTSNTVGIIDSNLQTTSSCLSFLLAMALFPEAQKKAQAELDRVVGPHRLPEFDDFVNLPYVRAVVKETIRWMPVIPFGLPHAVTADDVYSGYRISKGTTIIPVSREADIMMFLTDALILR